VCSLHHYTKSCAQLTDIGGHQINTANDNPTINIDTKDNAFLTVLDKLPHTKDARYRYGTMDSVWRVVVCGPSQYTWSTWGVRQRRCSVGPVVLFRSSSFKGEIGDGYQKSRLLVFRRDDLVDGGLEYDNKITIQKQLLNNLLAGL